jgi:hypothetical protein
MFSVLLRTVLAGISDLHLRLAHRTLLLPWTQRTCHQNRIEIRGIPTARFARHITRNSDLEYVTRLVQRLEFPDEELCNLESKLFFHIDILISLGFGDAHLVMQKTIKTTKLNAPNLEIFTHPI